jgi:hypothetical protein
VIRVQPSSPPACAALSFAARTAGRLPVCSPPFPFGTGGSLLAGAPAARLLPGAGISQRPFARPQRLSASGPPLRGQSSRPATSTPCRAAPRDRSARDYPAPAGLHPARSVSRPLARIPSRGPALPSPHRISTPLRGFHPIRLKAFNPTRPRKARLPGRPDHPSLPAPALFYRRRHGSSFRVRYLSGGPLFLKPLGTSLIMHPGNNRVNVKLVRIITFPQEKHSMLPISYKRTRVNSLWKKRRSAKAFPKCAA